MNICMCRHVKTGHHGETGDHQSDDPGLYVTHIERNLAWM